MAGDQKHEAAGPSSIREMGLEREMRQAQAMVQQAARERSNLGTRIGDVVAQLHEIARYSNDWANQLEQAHVAFERNIQRMLGKE